MNSFLGVSDHRHSTESCKNPVRRRSLNHEVRWRGTWLKKRECECNLAEIHPSPRAAPRIALHQKLSLRPPASLLGKKDCVLDPSSEVLANNEATPLSFWHFRTIATREQGLTLMLGKGGTATRSARRSLPRSLTHPDITSHTDTHHARASLACLGTEIKGRRR